MKDYEVSELYETMNPGSIAKKFEELQIQIDVQKRVINDLKLVIQETLSGLDNLYNQTPSSVDHRLNLDQ